MTAISERRSPTRISHTRRRHLSGELLETRQLLSTFVVSNPNDSGRGTLRAAILSSNSDTAQTNLITFNLGTSGVQTINLASALPVISQAVTIDGTTEPGYSGTPLVELNGSGAGSGTDGLQVEANDTTIEGLAIGQFGGDGIDESGSDDVIAANDIGLDPTATSAFGNGGEGVMVTGSNDRIVRSSAGYANFIVANGGDGLLISGAGASGNVVAGNFIGLGPHATGNQGDGILVNSQASHNLIGTNGDGVNDPDEGNLISNNVSWGIRISGPGTDENVVAGNSIGTNHPGAVGNGGGGVCINDGAQENFIGTDGVSAANADESNLISGNDGVGVPGILISDSGTNFNVVAGNLIGTFNSGTTPKSNSIGVSIENGAQSNVIGTNGDGNGDAAERNVISGNTDQGVYIGGSGTNFNIVAGNLIGVDITGANPLGNGDNGVLIADGAQSNRIGVNAGDAGAADEPNVIGANTLSGITLSDPGTTFNTVSGNFIGTDTALGYTSLNNGEDGISIRNGAQSNTIGGSTALANFIRFNTQNGVGVYDNGTTGNTIRFNSIDRNSELGIELGGTGRPNNLVTSPSITSVGYGTTTTVAVSFVSLPNGSYTIDFYASTVGDGEGNRWLGSVSVTTDANGQAIPPTTFNLPANTLADTWITATATDQAGDTSEFSNARELTALSSQVTVSPSITSATYGQPLTFTATVAPFGSGLSTPTGAIQFEVDGSPFGSAVTLVDGAGTSVGISTLPAGDHTISGVYSGDLTYSTNSAIISQMVTPAPLTITADDKSNVYGAAEPALTYTVTGLANGDTPSIISGVTLSTTTGAAATAGTHAITATGGTAANYAITDVNGTLTVSKAPLTVTADNKSKVFGAADPTLTFTPGGSLYYGDSYSVINGVTLSTTTGAAATAGLHAITATGGTAANYAITDVNGTLTVTPLPLVTVTGVKQETVHLKKRKTEYELVITFSGALGPVGADNPANYHLARSAQERSPRPTNPSNLVPPRTTDRHLL